MMYCIELGKPYATIRSHECLLKLKISPPFGSIKLDTRSCGSAQEPTIVSAQKASGMCNSISFDNPFGIIDRQMCKTSSGQAQSHKILLVEFGQSPERMHAHGKSHRVLHAQIETVCRKIDCASVLADD